MQRVLSIIIAISFIIGLYLVFSSSPPTQPTSLTTSTSVPSVELSALKATTITINGEKHIAINGTVSWRDFQTKPGHQNLVGFWGTINGQDQMYTIAVEGQEGQGGTIGAPEFIEADTEWGTVDFYAKALPPGNGTYNISIIAELFRFAEKGVKEYGGRELVYPYHSLVRLNVTAEKQIAITI